ncbi:MAG: hypothetical protein HYR55_01060 [Acidobacteria bacterium]|nr:hypothetical protein [Acidobacteriota bacterium]MBI3655609.1 hypothetical protein [Acidobacteriota bacterium]
MKELGRAIPETIFLCEWDSIEFRKKLEYWESKGYTALLSTYKMSSEVDPGTGKECLRYTIDLKKSMK